MAHYYDPRYHPTLVPPRPDMIPLAQHEAALAKERQRFDGMHMELSAEIRRLKDGNEKMKTELTAEIRQLKKALEKERQGEGATEVPAMAESITTRNKRRSRTPAATRTTKRARAAETQEQQEPTKPSKHEEKWNSKLGQLETFKEEHGHCDIPKTYKEDPQLATWVMQQRTHYRHLQEGKRTSMTQERIRRLTALGFKWKTTSKKAAKPPKVNKQHEKWNARFEQLKAFKAEHGHCNVPITYKDPKLAQWVSDQRSHHRFLREGKPTSMTPERIRRLTALGFKWSVAKTQPLSWEERIAQLAEYKAKHGHCNVPQKCKDCPPGLGNFVLEKRRTYKALLHGEKPPKNKLSLEQIEELEALGFEWSLRNRGQKDPFMDS